MVTSKIRKNFVFFQIFFILMLFAPNTLAFAKKFFRENTKNPFDSIIVRYVHETDNESPLIHLINHGSKSNNIAASIVKSCSRFANPLMLFHFDLDESINRTSANTVKPRQCHPCSKFHHVIALFPNTRAVRPENMPIIYKNMWNPGARIAILINDVTIDRSIVNGLLRSFWSMNCGNVVIASLESSMGDHRAIVHSYDPFFLHPTKRRSTRGKNRRGTMYPVSRNESLFPEKFADLRGHEIVVSLYRHDPHAAANAKGSSSFDRATGLDSEIIRYAAKRLNFTISLTTEDVDLTSRVVSLSSGELVGPIGDVLIGRSEYLANAQYLEAVHPFHETLQFIYPRWRSQSVIIVRRALPTSPIVHWIKILGQQRQTTMILIAGGLCLVVMIFYLRSLKRNNFGQILLIIVGLALFQNFPKIGKLTSDRIYCLSWIFGTFVVCTLYQGNLLNEMTSVPIYDNIEKLNDLLELTDSLRLMVRPYERSFLASFADPSMNDPIRGRLYDNSFVQLNFSACLVEMNHSRSIACAIDRSYGYYALGQVRRYELMLEKNPATMVTGYARTYLLPPIHVVDESLMEFWKTYVVKRDFPYLKMINEAIARTVEFGLINKWYKDDKDTDFREPQAPNRPRTLSMVHEYYTFVILIVGHVIAAFVLCCEIAIARAQSRRKCRKKSVRRVVNQIQNLT